MENIECKNCGEYTPLADHNLNLIDEKIELEIHCKLCEKVSWVWIDQDDLEEDINA